MPSRLWRYVFKDFAVTSLVAYVSLLCFFSIFEMAEFARLCADKQKPFSLALHMTSLNLPIVSIEVGPLSLLVAIFLSGSAMSRRGELVAVYSAGIAPWKVYLPVAVWTAASAACLFFVNDRLMPQAQRRMDSIMLGDLGRSSQVIQFFNKTRHWFLVDKKLVRVGAIDANQATYYDMHVLEMGHGSLKKRTSAERVLALGPELIGSGVTIESYQPSGELSMTSSNVEMMPLQRRFNAFLDLSSKPQKMHLSELDYVFKLRSRQGYNPRMYELEFYTRILYPFFAFMLVMTGMSYAFFVQPKRTLIRALVELLGVVGVAFVVRQVFRSLAMAQTVSAQVGAIGPVVVLVLFATYRLVYRAGR